MALVSGDAVEKTSDTPRGRREASLNAIVELKEIPVQRPDVVKQEGLAQRQDELLAVCIELDSKNGNAGSYPWRAPVGIAHAPWPRGDTNTSC